MHVIRLWIVIACVKILGLSGVLQHSISQQLWRNPKIQFGILRHLQTLFALSLKRSNQNQLSLLKQTIAFFQVLNPFTSPQSPSKTWKIFNFHPERHLKLSTVYQSGSPCHQERLRINASLACMWNLSTSPAKFIVRVQEWYRKLPASSALLVNVKQTSCLPKDLRQLIRR